jgi:hypothetical protein
MSTKRKSKEEERKRLREEETELREAKTRKKEDDVLEAQRAELIRPMRQAELVESVRKDIKELEVAGRSTILAELFKAVPPESITASMLEPHWDTFVLEEIRRLGRLGDFQV